MISKANHTAQQYNWLKTHTNETNNYHIQELLWPVGVTLATLQWWLS